MTSAVLASAALHAGLLLSGAWLLTQGLAEAPGPPSPREIEVAIEAGPLELPSFGQEGNPSGKDQAQAPREPDMANGGAVDARAANDTSGRGGSKTSDPAVNLSDSVDGISLDRDPLNHLSRSQVQRLDTSAERRSDDDRRATPNPMQLSFVVSGAGKRSERRTPSKYDPAQGSLVGGESAELGGALGLDLDPDGNISQRGSDDSGAERARRAAGVSGGSDRADYRLSAAVQLARPLVPRARAAVPARIPGPTQDTQDSTQEVSAAVRSLLQASSAGGPKGQGPGGEAGLGAPGAGGEAGPGSRSRAAGLGGTYQGGPPRGLTPYFRDIERKIDWRRAFPDWAIAEGRSGLAIVGFSLGPRGEVRSMRVERRSGVPEFDAGVLEAIRRAAPFGPPPKGLRTPLAVRMSFDALNPVVGRDGGGRGGKPRVR